MQYEDFRLNNKIYCFDIDMGYRGDSNGPGQPPYIERLGILRDNDIVYEELDTWDEKLEEEILIKFFNEKNYGPEDL
jgi:hypothetical protein